MTNLSPEARAWLRDGGPNLAAVGYPLGPWAMIAGRVCDFARVPVSLGVQMLSLSRSDKLKDDHTLGPAFVDHAAHAVTFLLTLGTAATLPGVLVCAQDVRPETVFVIPEGKLIRVAPPLGAQSDGLEWLQEADGNPPFLPAQGTFAYLVGLASLTLGLAPGAKP